MNSDKNGKQKLPDGWILCKSKTNSGRKYFFNKKTGKSSWTQPQADDKPGQSKPKGKKEKPYCHEKGKVIKKPEPQNKNLKRKSDSKDDGYSKKKQKQETRTPEKQKLETQKKSLAKNLVSKPIKKDSPLKPSPSSSRSCQSGLKPTPTKNIANSRLSQLRAQLNAKVKPAREDETNKSPSKNHKISPKIPLKQTETPSKVAKLELKSPNFNESKCSTTQSPSSDSFQSIPSPSQFVAANKIIASMKAQLPDEYCNKAKPKDTFADIEQGICNQTAEYPFMKHPATPPQFSEANKLVSAIKSKLSYKGAAKDTLSVGKNKAKERMEVLRTRLSNEAVNNEDFERNFLDRIELPKSADEAMEVEESKEVTQSVPSFQCTKNNIGKENVVLVVDTNIFIHELDVIKNVLNSHIKGYTEQPTLLVPWRVVNELDRLKDNNNGNGAICKRARAAMDYLYKSLPENNRIKGQSLRDSNSHIYPCELPDDEILNCCLQQAERGKSVILLSNDKNLCNKAMMNCVKCIGLDELKSLLENKPQPAADPDLHASVKHYENTMYHLLANILENEMRAKYNNLWQHVLFKAPPWTLSDVLQCLLKHWIAVFNEVFPRIEHLIADLRNTLVSIESKDPKSLSKSEVTNFKELCSEIAKKCQIIPEYMELAKSTVERLSRKCEADPDRKEMPVIDAFEGLWTVFSSYCSKLASGLGVAHNVEDKLPSQDPLHVLTSKWPMFSAQIYTLTHCMKESLNMDNLNSDMESHVARLEAVFRESLALVGMNSGAVNKNNMRIFCTSCRNMLHEAVAKFSELTELLDVCKTHIAYD